MGFEMFRWGPSTGGHDGEERYCILRSGCRKGERETGRAGLGVALDYCYFDFAFLLRELYLHLMR